MRALRISFAVTLVGGTLFSVAMAAQAQGVHVGSWRPYVDPSTGTRVDFPEGLFVPSGSAPRGKGQLFRTSDGRAEFSIYTVDRARGESPRRYLQQNLKVPRRILEYERVTPNFFAISAADQGRVYYSRCNLSRRAAGRMHCIYLAYPERETKAWDGVVTRISRSLRPLHG